MKKICIVITGPTAIGKTALAIKLAQHFNTQIISADSRQCYKELTIGVAKPSTEELALVKHHFINSHSIHEDVNAAVYENYALQKIDTIFKTNNVAVVVGGTGLYIKAFCQGMDDIPTIDKKIKEDLIKNYEQHGLGWLQQQIETLDKVYAKTGETKNPNRLIRALEVVMGTGKSITSFQQQAKKERNFTIIKIGLELPREELYQRINNRVEVMMKDGLLNEVKQLLAYQKLSALQTVGYRELFDYLEDKITLQKAVELIKQNTRHYAKRQLTWFKKDEEIIWLKANLVDEALQEIISLVHTP